MWYNIKVVKIRPVGQAVKTLASHAGNMGSIPVRVTKKKTHTTVCVFFLVTTENPLAQKRRALKFSVLWREYGFENLTKDVGSSLTDGSADSADVAKRKSDSRTHTTAEFSNLEKILKMCKICLAF